MRKILFSLCFSFFCLAIVPGAHAASDEKEVVVTGIGTTEDKAKQQAYRSAIQSVIGAMVLSETIVENDTLMRDKILSHSDGYVVKATQVGATRQLGDGLLEVTMRITVKSEQLKAKLKAENITMAAIDGQSLFAQKSTQAEAKQDAAAIIKEKVKDLPANLLVAEANVQGSTQKDMGGGSVQLTIPLKLSVDAEKYKSFVTDLKGTLKKLGFKEKNVSVKLRAVSDTKASVFGLQELLHAHTGIIDIRERSKYNLLGVAEFASRTNIRVASYFVPTDVAMAFQKNESFAVHVELIDASGAVVVAQEWRNSRAIRRKEAKSIGVPSVLIPSYTESIISALGGGGSTKLKAAAMVLPTPIFDLNNHNGVQMLNPGEFNFSMTFDLSDEELKSITSIKCTVVNTDRKE